MDQNSQVIEISTGQRVGPFALSMPVKIPNQINIPPEEMNKRRALYARAFHLYCISGVQRLISLRIL